MKLKFFTKRNLNGAKVTIGTNGQLRFSMSFVSEHNIQPDMMWLVALDEDEAPHYRYLYLLTPSPDSPAEQQYRTTLRKGSCYISARNAISELNLPGTIRCDIEEFTNGTLTGFRVTILP